MSILEELIVLDCLKGYGKDVSHLFTIPKQPKGQRHRFKKPKRPAKGISYHCQTLSRVSYAQVKDNTIKPLFLTYI